MEHLFTSGTIRPLRFPDIPEDTVVTYVNPVCSEKLNDDAETLKLRTRVTIGGDRIDYPYDKSTVTANMEALKLLINAMIYDIGRRQLVDHRHQRLLPSTWEPYCPTQNTSASNAA
jgi:hypothetical protein